MVDQGSNKTKMSQTTARIKKEGKNFEILVDLDEALKVKKGEGSINSAVLSDAIFYNIKSGEHASSDDLKKAFGSEDVNVVAEKIIKNGEVVMTTEHMREEQSQKYKQVVDFLVKNAVSPSGSPYTPDRIETALKEAGVNVKNKPVEAQISEILEQLQKIIAIKIETKKIKVTIPAAHTGQAYGVVQEFKESEEWLGSGDLVVVLNIPAGLVMDFYDKLNGVTHGAALSEEIGE